MLITVASLFIELIKILLIMKDVGVSYINTIMIYFLLQTTNILSTDKPLSMLL